MIIRTKKQNGDYFIMHRSAIENPALSFKAKGVLAYLMSKPDSWEVHVSDLTKRSTDKEAAVRSAMAELEEQGYMTRRRDHGKDGKFTWICTVTEYPVPVNQRSHPETRRLRTSPSSDFPQMVNPQMENPQMGNRYPSNNDCGNNDCSKNEEELPQPTTAAIKSASTTATPGANAPAHAAPSPRKSSAPAPELLPQSQDERVLFGLLHEAAQAQGRNGPKRFANPEQARAFRAAVAVLNGKTQDVLKSFMRGGGGALGNAVAYVAGAARKEQEARAEKQRLLTPAAAGEYVSADDFFTA